MKKTKFKIGDTVVLNEKGQRVIPKWSKEDESRAFVVIGEFDFGGVHFFVFIKDGELFSASEKCIAYCCNPNVIGGTNTKEGNKVTMFSELTSQMLETFKKKNADYGDSTTKTFKEFGLISYAVRLDDKLSRIKSFCKKGALEVKDESIVDTLLDAANYCLLAVIDIKNQKRYEKSHVRDGE